MSGRKPHKANIHNNRTTRSLADWLAQLIETLESKGEAAMATVIGPLTTGELMGKHWLLLPNGKLYGDQKAVGADQKIVEVLSKASAPAIASLFLPAESLTLEVFIERLFGDSTLVIAGGGHIAQPLCAMGHMLGFRVIVVDDRPEYATAERFPQATRLEVGDFAAILRALHITPATYIVIITHGHTWDYQALRAVIDRPAAYIGMIGSRRKVAGVFGQLQAEGVSKERIHRVHAPIGLDIGAEMPAEIAISILAEITQQRRRGGGHLPSMSGATAAKPQPVRGSDESMDFWQQVAAWRNRGPVALATIVAAEGSTPRGPGARMALAENERLGSVGGGPGEVEVERLARQALSDGRPRRLRLDLHEEPSPGLGATCGGTVVVFIERLGHLHRAG